MLVACGMYIPLVYMTDNDAYWSPCRELHVSDFCAILLSQSP